MDFDIKHCVPLALIVYYYFLVQYIIFSAISCEKKKVKPLNTISQLSYYIPMHWTLKIIAKTPA